jgi:uncharacterized protein
MSLSNGALAIAAATLCLAAPSWAQSDESAWQADPFPAVAHEPMTFHNGDIKLAGTLYIPEHADHVPAVIVFWGPQAPTREFAMYQQLATGLPAIGVGVLIFDRRGSGESGGSDAHTTFQELASDGIAALHSLQRDPRIDSKRIGFWGLSQGGWLAILAATSQPNTSS